MAFVLSAWSCAAKISPFVSFSSPVFIQFQETLDYYYYYCNYFIIVVIIIVVIVIIVAYGSRAFAVSASDLWN